MHTQVQYFCSYYGNLVRNNYFLFFYKTADNGINYNHLDFTPLIRILSIFNNNEFDLKKKYS